MVARHISSRKDPMKIKGFIKDLPNVLVGIKRDHHGLRREFWSVFAKELYLRISRAYLEKSTGKIDDVGESWEPLSPRTIEKRLNRPVRYSLLRKSKTFREAVKAVKTGNVPILIDTGRLYRSLLPGEVLGGNYQKRAKDQIFKITKGQVSLGTKVPYAGRQHATRPLWPADLEKWSIEATVIATKQLAFSMKAKGLV